MDVYTTPGAFSWSELMTSDPASAREFYGALFGWRFDDPIAFYYLCLAALAVTGLSVITPAQDLTVPGQIVLMVLIQIGGVGSSRIVSRSTSALRCSSTASWQRAAAT